MNMHRFISVKKNLPRWIAAAILAVGGLVSNAFAEDLSVSGNWQELYKTATTDSHGNTTYSLDFHTSGSGIPITETGLPGIAGSVIEDLSVSYGSSGTPNGSGGPVILSELVITQGTNQATFDITGATLTQYGSVGSPGTWLGFIEGGTATLETGANKTTPTFLADLANFHTASFSATYTGAWMFSSSSAAMLAPTGQAGFTMIASVPEPSSIVTTTIGAAILGGFLWRRRRAAVKSGVGSVAVTPC